MSQAPQRIQRQRTRGWRMPEDTVYVGRGSIWGNPFKIVVNARDVFGNVSPISLVDTRSDDIVANHILTMRDAHELAVHHYRVLVTPCTGVLREATEAVEPDFALRQDILAKLRGKNLACWCPLDQPCHADVLLELANAREAAP